MLQWFSGIHVYFSFAGSQEGQQTHELLPDSKDFPAIPG